MVDLHAHFLPGIDDGARTVEESLAMLAESYRQGVRHCIATPHCILHKQDALSSFCQKREASYNQLTANMEGTLYPALYLGAEVYFDHDISQRENLENLCLGDSRYILLELPVASQSPETPEWLHALSSKGFKPILAHIDRYPNWRHLLQEFGGLSVLYQIDAQRFLGFLDRRLVKQLLATGERFIVSSDMHNLTTRPNLMQKAREIAFKKFPLEAEKLFAE